MTTKTMLAALIALGLLSCAAGADRDPSATSATEAAATEPDDDSENDDVITDVPGHVVEVMDEAWALQPEDDEGTRYAPDELPEEFLVDGLAVIFSGEVGEIPPNVRLWGTPLHLTDIRRRDE